MGGDCICGKCECYPRDNADERVYGDYCECDNFSCDRYNGELCSGPDHGECVCGKCKCNSEWDVEGYTACECRASNETCITPYGEHINKSCVQCQVFGSGELMGEKDEYGVDKCSLCPFKPEIVEKAEDLVQNDERLCTFIDDDDCRFTFVYGYKNETGELQVWVQETK